MNKTTNIAEIYAQKIWIEKDFSAIEEYLHENIAIHSPLGNLFGHEAMRQIVTTWMSAFPDLIVRHLNIVSEGDFTVIHWQAEGTHQNEFKNIPPTGKRVSYSGVSIYRMSDGKVIEYWGYLDMNHVFAQLRH